MAVWKLAPALAMGNIVRAEAGVRHAADRAAAGRAARRDRAAQGRGEHHHRRRRDGGRGARVASRRGQGVVHRLDRRRPADHAAGLLARSRSARSSWAASRRTSCTRTRTWTRRWTARCGRTFFHQGQVCESGTRLLVPESIHDEFVERLVARAKQIKIGDALDYDTDMGPLVSQAQLDTVENYVRIGQEEGAKLVLGGGRPEGAPEGGYFFEPTIFTEVDNSMTIAQEEIFGPVLSVIKFKNDDEAIRIANDTIYGLAAAVWSEDYDRCLETAKKLRAGTVWINDHHLINCIAPFGGYKQSGNGRELGHLRPERVHRGQARARGPDARPERKMFGVLLSRSRQSRGRRLASLAQRPLASRDRRATSSFSVALRGVLRLPAELLLRPVGLHQHRLADALDPREARRRRGQARDHLGRGVDREVGDRDRVPAERVGEVATSSACRCRRGCRGRARPCPGRRATNACATSSSCTSWNGMPGSGITGLSTGMPLSSAPHRVRHRLRHAARTGSPRSSSAPSGRRRCTAGTPTPRSRVVFSSTCAEHALHLGLLGRVEVGVAAARRDLLVQPVRVVVVEAVGRDARRVTDALGARRRPPPRTRSASRRR